MRQPANRTRRFWLAALSSAACGFAWAQSLVEIQLSKGRFSIVAPFPPGGPVDTLSRILAEGLQKHYGQAAIVENLVGGAGNIGMDKVRRAKNDGHTLLVVPAGNLTINPSLMANFPFNIDKDFAPITLLAKTPNVLVASAASNFRNVKDVIAAAKAKPNALSYASPGVGSGLHLAGELFKFETGIDLLHVPYKGTPPALNDVLAGVVPLMFSNLSAALAHIRSGRLVALGITDSVRSPLAPDIPTFAEQGVPGVIVTSWYGLLAPAGTPSTVTEQLAKDAAEILAQPAAREQLKAQSLIDATQKPAAFAATIRQEAATWARIIKARNITSE